MKKRELKNKLDELNINTSYYSLDGVLKPNRYTLLYSNSKWWTFLYDERGRFLNKMSFDTEDEACQNMLILLIKEQEFQKKYHLDS